MLKTFIDDVLLDLKEKNTELSQCTFILPSKRAGSFLKHAISKQASKTIFSPIILSIEEFVENISSLKSISNTEQLFELYKVYLENTPKENTEAFGSFCKWAQIIIQDFNEIDRYLVPTNTIFSYLSAIKEVNHWSVSSEKTELVNNYLSFWKKLPIYYKKLSENLLLNNKGYQGLIYKEAVNRLETYTKHNSDKKHIFLGFNALNTAEQIIIKELLQQGLAEIYWDIDSYFLETSYHDAGLFIRQHREWSYYQKNIFNWEADNYKSNKNIDIIGVPKNVGQAKHVGELLSKINASKGLKNTAVVLGDESLLMPLINSIPKEIGQANITMGVPLHLAPISALFDALFKLHKSTADNSKVYYKDFISIVSNPFLSPIFNISATENITAAHGYISKNNVTHLSIKNLKNLFESNEVLIDCLFSDWKNNSKIALENFKEIIRISKEQFQKNKENNLLALEYLFRFNNVFNQVSTLIDEYKFTTDLQSLSILYQEIMSAETLDFQGEALQGLQIIGMLESRVIDFETVIITSVNEGILPSGKSNNTFIPFDVKIGSGLPTYKEKDAVYTYHFYHLLQRAKNIYILYNTEVDAFNGGEKSRFITQLEVANLGHNIKNYFISPQVPKITNELRVIKKTAAIINRLKDIASKGFSPSSLTSYIRNPLDFYYQKILGINSFDDVEESVASNTHGTIIHNTLEDLYKPYIGKVITVDDLLKMKPKIEAIVQHHFVKEFKDGDISFGKNLIIYEITKRYISNFLNTEIDFIKQGNTVKIIALEKETRVSVNIPELEFPVYLKGTVDRVDKCNGTLRIIDYKSGNVTSGKVEIVDWDAITKDYDKYSKSFQILTYAYMLSLEKPFDAPIEAGIISFKNLKQGLLKFAKKEAPKTKTKDTSITQDTLNSFFNELKKLIVEICNPDIDIVEKEI